MFRLLAVLLTFAGLGLGQAPNAYFPWWDRPISNRLNLTADQRDNIRSILQSYRDRMIDERAAVEKAEASFADIFAEDEVDDAAVRQAMEELIDARDNLTRSMTTMGLELRQVLTSEQWRRLRDLQERQERRGVTPPAGPAAGPRNQRRQAGPPPANPS